jgi:hypothetical protein
MRADGDAVELDAVADAVGEMVARVDDGGPVDLVSDEMRARLERF